MYRMIVSIFMLLSLVFLITLASLFNGINIDKLVYNHIKFTGLYLKFDKNLIVSIKNISVEDLNTSDKQNYNLDFKIDYYKKHFIIDIKDFKIQGTDLDFDGKIIIATNELNPLGDKKFLITDVDLMFDKKMERFKSKLLKIKYRNRKFEITSDATEYMGIDLKGTKTFFDIRKNTLEFDLKTKSLYTKDVQSILSRYEIDLPIEQVGGKNNTSANILIPFDDNTPVSVDLDVRIQNSKLFALKQQFNVKDMLLNYKNNIITSDIELTHVFQKDEIMVDYNATIISITNLDNNLSIGDIKIKNLIYKEYPDEYNISDSQLSYQLDFNNTFSLNSTSDMLILDALGDTFYLNEFSSSFKNNYITSLAKVVNKNKNIQLDIVYNDDLINKKSNGTTDLIYTENNVTIISKNVLFNVDYTSELVKFELSSNDATVMYKDDNITLKNISLYHDEEKAVINTDIEYLPFNLKSYINTTITQKQKKAKGTFYIDQFFYDDMVKVVGEEFSFDVDFNNTIKLDIPKFSFKYLEQLDTSYSIDILEPNKLARFIAPIKSTSNQNSKISITSDDKSNISVDIKNFNIDLNTSYFNQEKDKKIKKFELPKLPDMKIIQSDSTISYDGYKLDFHTLNTNISNNNIEMNILKSPTNINIKLEDNGLFLTGKFLTGSFVNRLINQDIFEGGYLNLNVYGDDINQLSGDTKFYKTKIKNVQVVNNLITFINTTPAIVNPLLALPTLFRMAESGFDVNGYFIDYGDGSFRYALPYKQLRVYDLFTDGKMANFKVNSHVDFLNDKLKSNVDITFLKDYTSVVRKIPLLGYILMGKDGGLHTSVDLNGTLKEQDIQTNTIKDAASGILGVFERIITLPFQPFLSDSNSSD